MESNFLKQFTLIHNHRCFRRKHKDPSKDGDNTVILSVSTGACYYNILVFFILIYPVTGPITTLESRKLHQFQKLRQGRGTLLHGLHVLFCFFFFKCPPLQGPHFQSMSFRVHNINMNIYIYAKRKLLEEQIFLNVLAGCTCQKLNSSYCEVRCWAYRLYHANRQISFLMFFHRGSNRVTRGQGRVPRVCTEEQIKGSALWYSTLPVMRKEKKKKKITRTWPYLYDSSSTFS